ncbi:ATP synthase F1 subunit gamma [Candidatus Roizmanbacteria bacterium]|nr:ATP synthase F1 subunit gamma [Candidatus Roizmanbacteria bacterium]
MNLRQVRKKTKSISNVRKITKAMELVSGIKMKKAQLIELEGRPYRESLKHIISKISPGIDEKMSVLLQAPESSSAKELCIYVSANKGLCGAFNINLFRYLVKNIAYEKADFITVGRKGAVMVGKLGRPIVADFSATAPLDEVSAIFQMALTKFVAREFSRVIILYNQFISTLKSAPRTEVLLPISLDFQPEQKEKSNRLTGADYLVEPSAEEIIEAVLKSFVEDRIRGAIISSEAGEHSSRMIAMKNATDNAEDVIYNFSLLGNKLRQEKITNELLDMVTAKESVEGN